MKKNNTLKLLIVVVYVLLAAAIVVFASSCDRFYVNPLTMYIIDSGSHNSYHYNQNNKVIKSNQKLLLVPDKKVSWYFRFEDYHIYDYSVKDGGDINKLFGITSTQIHQNSARIGWRGIENNRFEIFAYWYDKGTRGFQVIDTLELHQDTYFEVNVKKKNFYFQVGAKSFQLEDTKNIIAFKSLPYFGGNNPAPHKMYFKIVEYEK